MTHLKRFQKYIATPAAALAFLATTGCSTTGNLMKAVVDEVKDLDYFLGIESLSDDNATQPSSASGLPSGFSNAALIEEGALNLPSPDLACLASGDPRFSYRKKVAFLALNLTNPQESVDLAQIHQRLPKALSLRFDRESFVAIDATHENLPDMHQYSPNKVAYLVRHLAQKYNVQFIVTGKIINTAYQRDSATFANKMTNWMTGDSLELERELQMNLSVYDGTTGSLIDENSYQGSARDRLSMTNKAAYINSGMPSSDYSALLDAYLSHQADWLANLLTCLPMQARVTSVTGKGITFATGTESLLMPGDRLKLLRRVQLQHTLAGQEQYRYEQNGEVVISQVYPNGALALFDGQLPAYQVNQGDIVQAW